MLISLRSWEADYGEKSTICLPLRQQMSILMLIILKAVVDGTGGMATKLFTFPSSCQGDLLTLSLGQCCLTMSLSFYFCVHCFLIIQIISSSIRNRLTSIIRSTGWARILMSNLCSFGQSTISSGKFSMAGVGCGFLLALLVGPGEHHRGSLGDS